MVLPCPPGFPCTRFGQLQSWSGPAALRQQIQKRERRDLHCRTSDGLRAVPPAITEADGSERSSTTRMMASASRRAARPPMKTRVFTESTALSQIVFSCFQAQPLQIPAALEYCFSHGAGQALAQPRRRGGAHGTCKPRRRVGRRKQPKIRAARATAASTKIGAPRTTGLQQRQLWRLTDHGREPWCADAAGPKDGAGNTICANPQNMQYARPVDRPRPLPGCH